MVLNIMMFLIEQLPMEFRKIAELDFAYEINSIGEMYSLKGKRKRLKIKINFQGYAGVEVRYKKKRIYKNIHRYVALAFMENPENKPCVIFRNGNIQDIRVENLQWATYKELKRHNYDSIRLANENKSTHCFYQNNLVETKFN